MMTADSFRSFSFIECASSRMYVRFSIPNGFSFSRKKSIDTFVEALGVEPVNLRGVDTQWAVHKHRNSRQLPGEGELVEGINDLLGPADGERGDDHLAAEFESVEHQTSHLLVGISFGSVLARAVRAFYLQVIHLVHRFGISQDVVSTAAHVTAKQVTEFASVFEHIQYHLRRAKDMTGIAKGHRQPIPGGEGPIVIDGDKLAHGFFSISRAIERFDGGQAAFGALFGQERRVVALDLGRIFQHHTGQITSGKGAVDISFETLPTQVREIPTMVDMRMA